MKQGIAALAGLLLLPATAKAEVFFEPPVKTLQLGLSALHFRYKEVNEAGDMLDREDGNLPGLYAAAHVEHDWTRVAATFSYHWGALKYDGHTQSGIPIQTRTDEALAETTLTVGHSLGAVRRLALYLGGGYRHWQRDIRSRGNVGGINELYTWAYAILGADLKLWRGRDFQLGLDLRGNYPISPKLRIHWPGNSGYLTLQLPSRLGYRVALPFAYSMGPQTYLAITPYYVYWKLPKSDPVYLSDNRKIWEPESTTKNVGVMLTFGF